MQKSLDITVYGYARKVKISGIIHMKVLRALCSWNISLEIHTNTEAEQAFGRLWASTYIMLEEYGLGNALGNLECIALKRLALNSFEKNTKVCGNVNIRRHPNENNYDKGECLVFIFSLMLMQVWHVCVKCLTLGD